MQSRHGGGLRGYHHLSIYLWHHVTTYNQARKVSNDNYTALLHCSSITFTTTRAGSWQLLMISTSNYPIKVDEEEEDRSIYIKLSTGQSKPCYRTQISLSHIRAIEATCYIMVHGHYIRQPRMLCRRYYLATKVQVIHYFPYLHTSMLRISNLAFRLLTETGVRSPIWPSVAGCLAF